MTGLAPARQAHRARLEDDLFLVIHLMIAGRLRWQPPGRSRRASSALAAFDFPTGTLILTEAGIEEARVAPRRARRSGARRRSIRGGLEVLDADAASVRRAAPRENHTLKRSLTDPRLFSGIGNAYSDEILHRARLSPVQLTSRLDDEEIARLFDATRATLTRVDRSAARARPATGFPTRSPPSGRRWPCTAASASRARSAARRCSASRYADNETNYCAALPDRRQAPRRPRAVAAAAEDWPRSIDDLD